LEDTDEEVEVPVEGFDLKGLEAVVEEEEEEEVEGFDLKGLEAVVEEEEEEEVEGPVEALDLKGLEAVDDEEEEEEELEELLLLFMKSGIFTVPGLFAFRLSRSLSLLLALSPSL
jgi:hypothetical protein